MKEFTPVDLAFWSLSMITFCNLNGLITMLFGIPAIFSPLILILSIFLIFYLPKRSSYFKFDYYLFTLTLITLFIIGTISGLIYFGETNFRFSYLFIEARNVITSLIIFTVYYLYTRKELLGGRFHSLFKGLLFLFFITLLFGVFESILGIRSSFSAVKDSSRSLGFFGNPNETGLQSNYTLILVLTAYLVLRYHIVLVIALVGLCLYGTLGSFSKTAMANVLFIFLFFFIGALFSFGKLNFRSRYIQLTLIVLLTISFIIVPRAKSYYDELELAQKRRIDGTIDLVIKGEFNSRTTSSRSEIFRDALVLIKEKPLLGNGIYTFTVGGMFPSSPTHGAHNLFLRILGEGGILPFFLFLAYLSYIGINGVLHPSRYISFLIIAALFSFSTYAFSTHGVLSDKVSVAFLGVISAITSQKKL